MTGSPDLNEEKLAQLRQALRNHLLFAAGKGGKHSKVRLSDYRGKKAVVLAFYPAAFTPV